MKLFSFIKNLFIRNTEVKNDADVKPAKTNNVPTHDIFGDVIATSDYLVPVEYVDVRRRGYVTIKQDFNLYRPIELKNTDIEKVMRLSTLESYINTSRVKSSRRHGFMHVQCNMQAFK